jgi:O-antigen biosynthesis protein
MSDVVARTARIIAEMAPKRVLVIGEPHAEIASALQAVDAMVAYVAAEHVRRGERFDLAVWRAAPALENDEWRRQVIATLCALTDHVLIEVASGTPATYWSERFAEQRFFVDMDAAARDGVLRFRRAAAGDPAGGESEVGRLRELADELYRALDDKDRLIRRLRARLAEMERSVGWKAVERVRPLGNWLLRHPLTRQPSMMFRRALEVFVEEGPTEALRKVRHKAALAVHGRTFLLRPRLDVSPDVDVQYQAWLAQHAVSESDLRRMVAAAEAFSVRPPISVITAFDGRAAATLSRLLETMRAQLYEQWQLCVATSGGAEPMAADARVTVAVTDGRESPLATALSLAHGDFVGFLDPRDALAPEALFELVKALNDHPDADIIYSDEDAVEPDGRRVRPFFKPDWSPDLLLSTSYMAGFALVRRSLLAELGGIRPDAFGAEAYDVLLRAVERTKKIVHVPRVLYHRRLEPPSVAAVAAFDKTAAAERLVLADALRRRGLEADIRSLPSDPHARPHHAVRYRLRAEPRVSIVIATRDKVHLLSQCIGSIETKTRYGHYEIIVVDNGSRDPETLAYFRSIGSKHRVYAYPGKFNFSAINNFGAGHATGDQLLFLNNDVEVITPDWLEAMLEHAQRADVGAVGAKLLYPDGRIQHAGVVVGLNGAAGNVFRFAPAEDERGPRLCDVVRNCSAVTAACLMIPRRVFEDARGFDERLPVAFQDVDLCLRIRREGRLVVYTPFAVLYHYEGASRGRRHPTADERLFQRLWAHVLERGDPYYNPNLTHVRDDWSLRLER